MRYSTVFFDRDGTLARSSPATAEKVDGLVRSWGGTKKDLTYERTMQLFEAAQDGGEPQTVEAEILFWKRYYRELLREYGVSGELEARAEALHEVRWLKSMELFPETVDVLEYFKSRGYRMGVISDTLPSLELTLEALGISGYFTSFTASSVVGAQKPSPVIFDAALRAQGVRAQECLYVDDYDVEADGARAQGFTSFLIDRAGAHEGPWVIRSLREMVDFAEREGS